MSVTVRIKDDDGDVQSYSVNKGVKLVNSSGTGFEAFIQPSGTKLITNTAPNDVAEYATAQVSDANLVEENIKNGVTILGKTGTYQGGAAGHLAKHTKVRTYNYTDQAPSQQSDQFIPVSVTLPADAVIVSAEAEIFIRFKLDAFATDNDEEMDSPAPDRASITVTDTQEGKVVTAEYVVKGDMVAYILNLALGRQLGNGNWFQEIITLTVLYTSASEDVAENNNG